jgi:hypothetical protein
VSSRVATVAARRSALRALSGRQRDELVTDGRAIAASLRPGLLTVAVGRKILPLVLLAFAARTRPAKLVRLLRYAVPLVIGFWRSRRRAS